MTDSPRWLADLLNSLDSHVECEGQASCESAVSWVWIFDRGSCTCPSPADNILLCADHDHILTEFVARKYLFCRHCGQMAVVKERKQV